MRFKDWDIRLARFTASRVTTFHEWGVHDCAIFAADCVLKMTGTDLMADIRGAYDSPISAARVIRQAGFESLGDMVAGRLDECEPSLAGRGDVVLIEGVDGPFLAVITGHTAVGPADFGLSHTPITEAQRAFRVI